MLIQQIYPEELKQETNKILVSTISCFIENKYNISIYWAVTGCIIFGFVISCRMQRHLLQLSFVMWLKGRAAAFAFSLFYLSVTTWPVSYFHPLGPFPTGNDHKAIRANKEITEWGGIRPKHSLMSCDSSFRFGLYLRPSEGELFIWRRHNLLILSCVADLPLGIVDRNKSIEFGFRETPYASSCSGQFRIMVALIFIRLVFLRTPQPLISSASSCSSCVSSARALDTRSNKHDVVLHSHLSSHNPSSTAILEEHVQLLTRPCSVRSGADYWKPQKWYATHWTNHCIWKAQWGRPAN